MTDGFHFDASCPRCGGELLPDGLPATRPAPDVSTHDARCDYCLDVVRVTVSVTVVEPWPIDRCNPTARGLEASATAALAEATTF